MTTPPPAHEVSDGELVRRCRAGDEAAWRQLVQRHARLVNATLRGGFRLSAHDAEDAFQEVFTRLYVKLGTVREGDAVVGWIAQVTRNVAVDVLRRNAREQPSGDAIDEAAFHEPLAAVEEAMLVREMLAGLPEHQREILDRFFGRDESYRAIAEALEIPPGTIASRISRALDALRAAVEAGSSPPESVTASG